MTQTATIIQQVIGRKRIITSAEMQALLLALHGAGLDLGNNYVASSQQSPEIAAAAWAKAVDGITFISASMGGRGLAHVDGWVRYDQPGSMHPMQHAEISFVSEELARGDHDAEPGSGGTMDYLRSHAARVVAVRADPPAPVLPAAQVAKKPLTVWCYCPDCGDEMRAEDRGKDTVCPRCARNISEYL